MPSIYTDDDVTCIVNLRLISSEIPSHWLYRVNYKQNREIAAEKSINLIETKYIMQKENI